MKCHSGRCPISIANRAYLYFSEDISVIDYTLRYERPDGSRRAYMDSRHQFPLAWFLFFEPSSICMAPDKSGDWEDLYLVREWSDARAAFVRRRGLLLSWLEEDFGATEVNEFLSWVDSLHGREAEQWLLVDPNQLDYMVDDGPKIAAVLGKLDDPLLSNQAKFEALDVWSRSKSDWGDEERYWQRHLKVFGRYYGPATENESG